MKCYMIAPSDRSMWEFDQGFLYRTPILKSFARTSIDAHRAYNRATDNRNNMPLSSVRVVRLVILERAS